MGETEKGEERKERERDSDSRISSAAHGDAVLVFIVAELKKIIRIVARKLSFLWSERLAEDYLIALA